MLVSAAHGVMPSLSCHFIKDCVMNVVNNYAVTELITYFYIVFFVNNICTFTLTLFINTESYSFYEGIMGFMD